MPVKHCRWRRLLYGRDVLGIGNDGSLGIEDWGKKVEIRIIEIRTVWVNTLLSAEPEQSTLLSHTQSMPRHFIRLFHCRFLSEILVHATQIASLVTIARRFDTVRSLLGTCTVHH